MGKRRSGTTSSTSPRCQAGYFPHGSGAPLTTTVATGLQGLSPPSAKAIVWIHEASLEEVSARQHQP